MIGKEFGRLTVIKRIDDYVAPSGGKHKKYLCKCSCGKEVQVLKEHLTSGRQMSCGCLKKMNGNPTHRQIHTRLYRIWGNMVSRCTDKNNPRYDDYGMRGIFVCEEWRKFENFYDWAYKNGYDDTLTIDRINNDDGYYPENCRWVSRNVQANNKRNNHIVEYHGKKLTLAELSREIGIPYSVLHHRISTLKWDIDRAVTQPVRKSPSRQTS